MEDYRKQEYLNGQKLAKAIFPFAKSAENSLKIFNTKMKSAKFDLDKYYYKGAIAETKKLMKKK